MNGNRSHAAASAARRPVISPVPTGVARPFWSVMIPTFDSGARLARTLESVLAQDPGPDAMQIRVIDDASPVDDPLPLVRAVAGNRVEVWRQPRNVGASVNFTTCVQQATGLWVHVLHSDDVVCPDFYPRYRDQIEAHPCVMAAGRSRVVDDDERELGVSPAVATADGLLTDAFSTIAREHPFNFVSVVVARATYEQVGGFDPLLEHANDWEMWTRIAATGPVAIVDDPLSMYRRHDDSDTARLQGSSAAYLDDVLRAIEIIAERHEDLGDGASFRREARRRWSAIAMTVGEQARAGGNHRLGWVNAWRAAWLDPRPVTLRHAVRTVAGRVASPGDPG